MFSAGFNPAGPTVPGRVNHPISAGGATVNPGDLVVGDADGVVVIERAKGPAAMLALADKKVADEAARIESIARGDTAAEVVARSARRRRERRRNAVSHATHPAIIVTAPIWRNKLALLLPITTSSMQARRPRRTTVVACAAGTTPGYHRALRQGGGGDGRGAVAQGHLQARQRHRHHRQGSGPGARH